MKVLPLLLLLASAVSAEIITKEVEYKNGEETLKGFVAYDNTKSEKQPAVIVVHEWWGHNDYARKRAKMLAEEGYVGFALDMYGEGKTANHPEKAGEFSSSVTKNAPVMLARFNAAVEKIKSMEQVDGDNIAAIGYCFGGAVVLNMARAGKDLKGVVSYHGALDTIIEPKPGSVKAKVLVFNGAADPFIPEEKVNKFKAEMKTAGADLNFINYPGVKHSFTNPDADEVAAKFEIPLAYSEEADKDSWQKTEKFFQEIFN